MQVVFGLAQGQSYLLQVAIVQHCTYVNVVARSRKSALDFTDVVNWDNLISLDCYLALEVTWTIYHQVAHQASPIEWLEQLESAWDNFKLHQVIQSIFNQNLGFPDIIS